MEENKSTIQTNPKPSVEHSLTLVDRKHLNITGVEKVVSIKPDLLQLKSSAGDIIVNGQNIEVTKLDLDQHSIALTGKFDSIKYNNVDKTPLLKKIFK
ncbi:MAG: YabP/YqfC family sporulation protein [Clostridia bacterium]